MKKITLTLVTFVLAFSLASAESKANDHKCHHHKMKDVCVYESKFYSEGARIIDEDLVCKKDMNQKILWQEIKD